MNNHESETRRLTSIAIIGGDLHAWSVAARLSNTLRNHNVMITLIDNQPKEFPGVLTTNPRIHDFHAALGVKEVDLIRALGGSYKYGNAYQNWIGSGGLDFIYGYSPCGQMIDSVQFHHYITRLRQAGKDTTLEPFSIAAVAAGEQRFTHPESGTAFEQIDYALQLDRVRYTQFLRAYAIDHKVATVVANVTGLTRDSQSGFITSLVLGDGKQIDADFYIDCVGTGVLPDELSVAFNSWSDLFTCDRRLDVIRETKATTPVVDVVSRSDAGWQKISPIPGGSFAQHHYCSELMSDQQVVEFAEHQFDTPVFPENTQVVEVKPGVLDQFWVGNCLAIGAATGDVDGHYFDSFDLTQSAIVRWLELYPDRSCSALLSEQYNRSTHTEYERIRDVHALPFAAISGKQSSSESSPILRRITDLDWPDSLKHRIELFQSTGRIAFYESDVLAPHQWVSMLSGFDIWPQRYDCLTNNMSIDELTQRLNEYALKVKQLVSEMPVQDDLLRALQQLSAQTKRV